jgi:hypothetical protein
MSRISGAYTIMVRVVAAEQRKSHRFGMLDESYTTMLKVLSKKAFYVRTLFGIWCPNKFNLLALSCPCSSSLSMNSLRPILRLKALSVTLYFDYHNPISST